MLRQYTVVLVQGTIVLILCTVLLVQGTFVLKYTLKVGIGHHSAEMFCFCADTRCHCADTVHF